MKRSDSANSLLEALAGEPAKSHELLFYSTFAHKTLLLIQRTGPSSNGYEKLQQTYTDAVTKVRALIQEAGEQHGFEGALALTEISHAGLAKLLDLMHDLAIIKQSTI